MQRLVIIFAAASISISGAAASAEPIGRLFTTPIERAQLDKVRRFGDQAVSDLSPTPAATQEPPADHLTLQGIVTRSSGKTTTWINQTTNDEHDSTKSVIVLQRPSRAPVVYLQTLTGRRINVKVGETLDTHSGAVHEVYEQLPTDEQQSTADKMP